MDGAERRAVGRHRLCRCTLVYPLATLGGQCVRCLCTAHIALRRPSHYQSRALARHATVATESASVRNQRLKVAQQRGARPEQTTHARDRVTNRANAVGVVAHDHGEAHLRIVRIAPAQALVDLLELEAAVYAAHEAVRVALRAHERGGAEEAAVVSRGAARTVRSSDRASGSDCRDAWRCTSQREILSDAPPSP